MPDTVPVTIEAESDAAAALSDKARRARVGRLVSRMLRPASLDRLFEVMDAISAEAERRGLTDEILAAELAATNAERRNPPSPAATVTEPRDSRNGKFQSPIKLEIANYRHAQHVANVWHLPVRSLPLRL